MQKADIPVIPSYYASYLGKVPEDDCIEALYGSLQAIKNLDVAKLNRIGQQVYAPGKWTVHQILQHLIDTERIFCFRALAFARKDPAELPGMDEKSYSSHCGSNSRSLEEIISELITVRNATISLFKSFSPAMMLSTGTANKTVNSVLGLGFFIAGHQAHHLGVIEERYSSLT
ncbi:MAG: DinB family protein [Bacteroidetes bacterium]|nr:DinB family protein [Bacteroidota bacterium]